MMKRSPSQLLTVAVLLLVVTGTTPLAASGMVADQSTEPQQAISGSEFVDASDNIEVWNRAALPLRVDPSTGDTVIKNLDPKVSVSSLGIDRARLDKDRVAIHDDESELRLRFRSKTLASTSEFGNQDVQLVAAHVEEDTQAARKLLQARSSITATEVLSLLTEDNLNNNVDFDLVENYGTLNGNGELPNSQYDLSTEDRGAGIYVFFVVQDYNSSAGTWGVTDGGFEESGGDLSVSSKSRVLGVDVAVTHQRQATATPQQQTYAAGSEVTFNVDANQDDGDVTHSIVLYDPQNFENRELIVEIDGKLDQDITADQVTIRREIGAVNGVAKIEGTPSVFGIGDLQDGRVSGVVDGAALIDFVAEQANSDAPLSATTSDPVTLDASVTVNESSDEAQVTVETLADWTPGNYKYVYVATGEDSSEITSAQGSLAIRPSRSAGKTLSGESSALLTLPSTASVSDVRFGFGQSVSGDVSVSELTGPPSGVSSVTDVHNVQGLVYLDISAPSSSGETTVTATFKKSSLSGVDPSNLSLWHYTGGQWVELETTLVSSTGPTVTVSATVSGFSPFVLAESSDTSASVGQSADGTSDGDSDALFSIENALTSVSSTTVSLGDDSEVLESVSLEFATETSGRLQIDGFAEPDAYTQYPGDAAAVLTVVDLEPPSDVRYDEGAVTFEVKKSALDAASTTADQLQVEQYDPSTRAWQTVETTVVETDGNTVSIRADVSDFGTYVVSTRAAQAESTVTTTTSTPTAEPTESPTAEPTDTPTAESTETTAGGSADTEAAQTDATTSETAPSTTATEFPGLGVTVALVAFLVTTLVLARRQR